MEEVDIICVKIIPETLYTQILDILNNFKIEEILKEYKYYDIKDVILKKFVDSEKDFLVKYYDLDNGDCYINSGNSMCHYDFYNQFEVFFQLQELGKINDLIIKNIQIM